MDSRHPSSPTPSVTQIVIQLAPLLLLVGGVFVFSERFARLQWIGFIVLGVMLVVCAAVSWAIYGLAQKQLLRHFTAQQVLWMLYVGRN